MHNSPLPRIKGIFIIAFVICTIILIPFYYNEEILHSYNDDVIFTVEEIEANGTHVIVEEPQKLFTTTQSNLTSVIPTSITTTQSSKNITSTRTALLNDNITDHNWLVSSNNCRILDLDPFNEDAKKYFSPEKYKSCTSLDLLTYVTKTDNVATLHIDKVIEPSYSKKGVTCCYSNVTRKGGKHPDDGISVSSCQKFDSNITLHHNPVIVKCQNDHKKQVYENAHYAFTITEDVQKKIENFDNSTRQASILFVGIDGISRLNFIRTMPNTYKHVEESGWLALKGYNKIGENTFPNLMAILTGLNSSTAYKVCEPKKLGKLDACPIIWYDFKKNGYLTAYAEDECIINTFNYNKVGFKEPPTDYYLRPYIMASEKLKEQCKDRTKYCTGPETAGERVMNLAKDFATSFKDYPNFGFFWMNSFSHNEINTPSLMDNKVLKHLKDLESGGVLEKSIIIFLADHGMRFGNIRLTATGWLEDRLPFIYFSFPKWFQDKFPKEISNFKLNCNRLTTPYDLHMTLQHILQLSGKNRTIVPSDACPMCKSLFEEMDPERSCQDAAIESHWCTCYGYTKAHFAPPLTNRITEFMLKQIHDAIRTRKHNHKCAKYSVDKIIDMRVSQKLSNRNDTLVIVQVKMQPKAVFETTLSFDGDTESPSFVVTGDITRLDSYSGVSSCTNDSYLKKYCYCRWFGARI